MSCEYNQCEYCKDCEYSYLEDDKYYVCDLRLEKDYINYIVDQVCQVTVGSAHF